MKWLNKKLKVARWLVLNRVSRSMVAEALLKAPVQLALLVRQARFVASEANQVIPALLSQNVTQPDDGEKGNLYPARFDVNPQTEDLLRRLILEFQPRRVVETGVANGRSTRVLLAAIEELRSDREISGTEGSVLHSLDISSSVVSLELSAYSNWVFHLVSDTHPFVKIMDEIGEIDMFLHDSNHAYWNQLTEYRIAWDHLAPGGLLVSDDVNWSQAFLHFCQENSLKPVVLADGTKFAGVVRKAIGQVGS